MGMTYTSWLEQENNQLKKDNALLKEANEKLKEQIDTSQTSILIGEIDQLRGKVRYWENEHDELAEENEKLKQQTKKLASENVRLQNELFTQQMNEDETNDYIKKLKEDYEDLEKVKDGFVKEAYKLKQQITQLKNIKRNDHKTIDRLITIITDEHYN